MIRYTLNCDQGHSFESWFQNASAFDSLRAGSHISCPDCGSHKVEKSLMAPRVRPSRTASQPVIEDAPAAAPPPAETPSNVPAQIAELKAKVEAESDYVGDDFVKEARAMHLGEAPERSIYGEANLDEAKALVDDGVPVIPLPFAPKRKVN